MSGIDDMAGRSGNGGISRAAFTEDLTTAFGLTPEQAEAQIALNDGFAAYYARRTGGHPDDWFSMIDSVARGDEAPDGGLFKTADSAGADGVDVAEAARLWREMGTDSPYFKRWFGDWGAAAAYRRNITVGAQAMDDVITKHVDVKGAFYRPEIGDIDLIYGFAGTQSKDYRDGKGISHLIERRKLEGVDGEKLARDLVDVIADGDITRRYGPPNGERVNIEKNGIRAVISLYTDGKKQAWVLTGFELNKKTPDATSGGHDPAGATLPISTRTQYGKGAGGDSSVAQRPSEIKASRLKFRHEFGQGAGQ